jgi:hypothetical protein
MIFDYILSEEFMTCYQLSPDFSIFVRVQGFSISVGAAITGFTLKCLHIYAAANYGGKARHEQFLFWRQLIFNLLISLESHSHDGLSP